MIYEEASNRGDRNYRGVHLGWRSTIQVTLVALTPRLQVVDTSTIDAYQGEENPMFILCMVGSQKLGFMYDSARLLTGVSRAGDALGIISLET
jgi:hypothetical protein